MQSARVMAWELEVIAAAGQPISQGAARTAARDATAGSIEVLRGHRLVRTHGSRDRDLVEPFHDWIRESVVAALRPDSLRELHRLLVLSLEAAREGDTQTLGEHWERAGDRDRAAGYDERQRRPPPTRRPSIAPPTCTRAWSTAGRSPRRS